MLPSPRFAGLSRPSNPPLERRRLECRRRSPHSAGGESCPPHLRRAAAGARRAAPKRHSRRNLRRNPSCCRGPLRLSSIGRRFPFPCSALARLPLEKILPELAEPLVEHLTHSRNRSFAVAIRRTRKQGDRLPPEYLRAHRQVSRGLDYGQARRRQPHRSRHPRHPPRPRADLKSAVRTGWPSRLPAKVTCRTSFRRSTKYKASRGLSPLPRRSTKARFPHEPVRQHSRARAVSTQFFCETLVPPCFMRTSPMRFMPLQAIHRLPSGVCTMLRTTPPPDGIAQV